jgi:hypothetical protein
MPPGRDATASDDAMVTIRLTRTSMSKFVWRRATFDDADTAPGRLLTGSDPVFNS